MKKGSVGLKPEKVIQHHIPSTWRAMEALFYSGKVRAIGVSNFSSKKLQDLLDMARVPPAVIQVECHPQWQQPKMHAFCESKGIHLTVSITNTNSMKIVDIPTNTCSEIEIFLGFREKKICTLAKLFRAS